MLTNMRRRRWADQRAHGFPTVIIGQRRATIIILWNCVASGYDLLKCYNHHIIVRQTHIFVPCRDLLFEGNRQNTFP